jgi:hypothetical protein
VREESIRGFEYGTQELRKSGRLKGSTRRLGIF